MHVTPSDLRTLQQDGTLVRFALLGSMAFVLAELPSTGSAGTPLEQPCTKPHWGFVVEGEVVIELDGHRQHVLPGSAFHLAPGGPPHRLFAPGAARMAAFEPIDPATDTTDAGLAALGFELLGPEQAGVATVVPAVIEPLTKASQIDARSWLMSGLMLTQARFGPGTGYTTEWCDAAHWGLVIAGRLAIEWEDDIEILAAGDIYHCPGGPPGHRLEAADPASIIDLTPVGAMAEGRRAVWRQRPAQSAEQSTGGISIAIADFG